MLQPNGGPWSSRLLALVLGLALGATRISSDAQPVAAVAERDATAEVIRALEQKVEEDPENFAVQNKLAGYYLRRVRETGSAGDIALATAAARASLTSVPAEGNPGGVAALARAQAAAHDFAGARDNGLRLTRLAPTEIYTYEILGDALLELGDYDGAGKAYARLQRLNDEKLKDSDPTHEARLARLALLRGDVDGARAQYDAAIAQAEATSPREDYVLAWCLVRAGELEFGTGRWVAAEERYVAALAAEPGDWAAVDHLAELRAAQKRYDEAASLYQALVARVPRPELFQALGDVYAAAGNAGEAKRWHRRALDRYLEAAAAGNAHYYHHLSGYYTDVERNPAEAVKWARKDLEVRRSVYAYDALAWALHHAGDTAAAAEAADRGVALGTRDAHLLYHASLIYHRAGDAARGAGYLRRAAEANPKFGEFHVHR